jgi:hypothetical protein
VLVDLLNGNRGNDTLAYDSNGSVSGGSTVFATLPGELAKLL